MNHKTRVWLLVMGLILGGPLLLLGTAVAIYELDLHP